MLTFANKLTALNFNQIQRLATDWAEAHNWSVDRKTFLDLVRMHMTGIFEYMLYVEYILEECNFHTENELIQAWEYDEAVKYYDHLAGETEVSNGSDS